MTTSDGPRAGWYGDGVTPDVERWFDGRAWTEHVRPRPGAPLPVAPPPAPAAPAGPRGGVPGAVRPDDRLRPRAAAPAAAAPVVRPFTPVPAAPAAQQPVPGGWAAPAPARAAVPAATPVADRAAAPAAPGGVPPWGAPASGPTGDGWAATVPGIPAGARPGSGYPSSGTGAWSGGANLATWSTPVPAHWGWRVLSRLVDDVVMGAPYAIAVAVEVVLVLGAADPSAALTASTRSGDPIALLGAFLSILAWFVNRVVAQGRTGRSLGRKLCRTRLVRESTMQPPGMWWAFVRDIGHVVDNTLLGLGYLWPLWDAKRQTFSDKLCTTLVVRED